MFCYGGLPSLETIPRITFDLLWVSLEECGCRVLSPPDLYSQLRATSYTASFCLGRDSYKHMKIFVLLVEVAFSGHSDIAEIMSVQTSEIEGKLV